MAVHVGLGNIPQLQCVLLALYVYLWVFVWFGTGIKSPSANDHFRHNNTAVGIHQCNLFIRFIRHPDILLPEIFANENSLLFEVI